MNMMTLQERREEQAVPDFVRDLRHDFAFEDEAADGETVSAAPVKTSALERLAWFRDLSLANKINAIFGTFFAVGALMTLVLGLGLGELWDRYNSTARVQEAVVAAGELESAAGELRYHTVRTLYDRSAQHRGVVIGTGNKSEILIGYSTIYGDAASAFNPIGDLYKTQVRELSRHLGVPTQIIEKAPSADLWPGQTDEGEGGFDYPTLDRVLYRIVDRRLPLEDVIAEGFDRDFVTRVSEMIRRSEFKRQMPPIAKVGGRSSGSDYLYPRRRPKLD